MRTESGKYTSSTRLLKNAFAAIATVPSGICKAPVTDDGHLTSVVPSFVYKRPLREE